MCSIALNLILCLMFNIGGKSIFGGKYFCCICRGRMWKVREEFYYLESRFDSHQPVLPTKSARSTGKLSIGITRYFIKPS
jgi:hypothetical protein